MQSPATTRPAPPSEPAAVIPPSARMTPLAIAALEAGVSADDVCAYLIDRYSVRPTGVAL